MVLSQQKYIYKSPINVSQKAVDQLFRISLGGENEKDNLSILTGKIKMICACEYLKV